MTTPTPFHRAPHTRAQGTTAERAASTWLRRQGFRIRHRNYRTKPGEIDLIAIEDDTLVFLEVKARSGSGFGPGSAAVTPKKQRRIARVASLYLTSTGWQGPCRFDVLAMRSTADGGWRFDLIRDAFRADG